MKNLKKHFKKKNILITGGLGFIGSNLARRLVNLDAIVTVIDNLIPTYGGNFFNVHDIQDKIHINISDVRDECSMRYLVQGKHYIFNLAGQTSHMDSMQDPYTDLEINSRAQLTILESCRHFCPDVKVVYASTRQIYGKPRYLPVDEKHPLCPTDVNGINKMAGECYHTLYNNVYGLKSCSLRLTNTFGPGMRIKDARQTFLGVWICLIVQKRPFEVWGGEQLRDINYVDDAVDALLITAASDITNGKVYNLGSPEVTSLRDLAKLIAEASGDGKYFINEFPKERKKIDIGDYYGDYSAIENDVGWTPKVGMLDGLRKTLEYYYRNLEYYL